MQSLDLGSLKWQGFVGGLGSTSSVTQLDIDMAQAVLEPPAPALPVTHPRPSAAPTFSQAPIQLGAACSCEAHDDQHAPLSSHSLKYQHHHSSSSTNSSTANLSDALHDMAQERPAPPEGPGPGVLLPALGVLCAAQAGLLVYALCALLAPAGCASNATTDACCSPLPERASPKPAPSSGFGPSAMSGLARRLSFSLKGMSSGTARVTHVRMGWTRYVNVGSCAKRVHYWHCILFADGAGSLLARCARLACIHVAGRAVTVGTLHLLVHLVERNGLFHV